MVLELHLPPASLTCQRSLQNKEGKDSQASWKQEGSTKNNTNFGEISNIEEASVKFFNDSNEMGAIIVL